MTTRVGGWWVEPAAHPVLEQCQPELGLGVGQTDTPSSPRRSRPCSPEATAPPPLETSAPTIICIKTAGPKTGRC